MRTGFLVSLLSGLLCGTSLSFAADIYAPVDKTLTRELDLTGDGSPEVVNVHFLAKDFHSPFFWTLTIASKGRVIYSVERDDTWLDGFFNKNDFVSDCKGYEECKRKYYFEETLYAVLKMVSQTGENTLYDDVEVGEDMGGGGVWHVGKEYLVSKLHLEEEKAVKIISALLERQKRKRLPFVSINISPIKGDSPMVYVEEIDGFMPVYRE